MANDVNHNGYDFLLPEGTPVRAAAAGSVTFAGLQAPSPCPSLGNAVVQALSVTIEHIAPDGVHYLTVYGHFNRVDVQPGQAVSAGQTLGASGNTGCSTAPHLHYAVYHVDPTTRQSVTTDP